MKTCDTVIDGAEYTATCEGGITVVAENDGTTLVTFKDPRELAAHEGSLVVLLKLYLRGVKDGAAQGRAALAHELRDLLGAAAKEVSGG